MTENDAISELEKFQIQVEHSIAEEERCEYDNLEKALQEDKEFLEAFDMAISALKEVQQYRKIGTVKEFREAVEKQKPKPCEFYGDEEVGNSFCPNCGEDLWDLKECEFNNCPYCGQAVTL